MVAICIEAVGVSNGGGSVVAQGVLDACVRNRSVSSIRLLVSSGFEAGVLDLPDGVEVRQLSQLGGASRGAVLEREVADAVDAADVLLSLSGRMPYQRRIPTVLYCQQGLPFEPRAIRSYGRLGRFRVRLLAGQVRSAVKHAQLCVVQTPWMAREVSALGTPVIVVSPPLRLGAREPHAFAEEPDRGDLIWLLHVGGAKAAYKRFTWLLKAFHSARSLCPELRLELAGAGPEDVAGHCLDGVLVRGWLRGEELAASYRRARALVTASLVESAGLPLYEAIGLSVPVIAPALPYATDALGQDYSGLYPWSSADSLAQQIVSLCASDTANLLASQVAERRKHRPVAASWDDVVDEAIRTF